MATTRGTLLGSLSGKVGTLVFCKWRATQYVRSVPVRKKHPKSQVQAENLSKFKLMQKLVIRILPFARLGFQYLSKEISAYNAALSYNLKNAIKSLDNRLQIDWQAFSFSRDLESPIKNGKLNFQASKQLLKVSWTCDSEIAAKYEPLLLKAAILVFPEKEGLSIPMETFYGESLIKGKQELHIPAYLHESPLHVYLAFFSSTHSKRSTNSIYLGII